MTKLILSAFADEYSDELIEQCEALNRFGIGYTELRFVDGKNVSELDKEEVERVKSVLSDYGLGVSAIGSPLGKIRLDGDMEGHFERAKHVFETAAELNAKYVRIFSFYLPDGETRRQCRSRVLDALGRMLDVAAEFNVTLCHENEALIYGEQPEECLDLLSSLDGLKCVFDMGNFALEGIDPVRAYEMLKGHIAYFHIKDALSAGAIVPAGKGEAKIKEILDRYKAEGGADTFITLEPHLQTFSGLNALAARSFDNPYKYENQRVAFADALEKLRGLL